MSDILCDRTPDGIVTLTLNRPDALNAFSFPMYEELIALLEGLRHDAQARVVIVTGAGRACCAGLALRAGDDGQLMEQGRSLAAAICANVPLGIWLTKQSLWMNQGVGSLEAACEIEARAVFMAQQTEDAAEKRQAFMDKRMPRFH